MKDASFSLAPRELANIAQTTIWRRLCNVLGAARGVFWYNDSNTLWSCEMQADLARGIVAAAATNDGRVNVVTATVGQALAGAGGR